MAMSEDHLLKRAPQFLISTRRALAESQSASHDMSRPSFGHRIVSRRAFGIPCDVTSVVATPTALRTFNQYRRVYLKSCLQA